MTEDGRHPEQKVDWVWALAEILRGDYKRFEYGKVILPLVVLRRLDCALADTKPQVLARYDQIKDRFDNLEPILRKVSGQQFYNTSEFDFERLLDDPAHVADNLRAYIRGFSPGAQEVIEKFSFTTQIDRLEKAGLLYQLLGEFARLDLHPDTVSNREMGYLFEELIRRFSEQSNETAGEHFTPREVIQLMVNLVFAEDDELLTTPGIVRTLYDPACGTGGMLSVAEEHLRQLNTDADLVLFGQELNDETYAICRADMMLKGHEASNIHSGNSFTNDGLPGEQFDYMLTNPPFGVDWNKYADPIEDEHERLGHAGRFGAGLPRKSDGQLLFLQQMLAKMKPPAADDSGGSRLAIVFNGSPLFSGQAGSGESEIRRWIVENDWLEAIVALPDQVFYNTGISTYIWLLTNRKARHRRGQVQLIDGRELYRKMRRNLGEKRNELAAEHIDEITRVHGDFNPDTERSKILDNAALGYRRITVERPLRLAYRGGAEAVEAVQTEKGFTNLVEGKRADTDHGRDMQQAIEAALATLPGDPTRDRGAFDAKLQDAFADVWSLLPNAVRKSVWNAVTIRDPEAEYETDSRGAPKVDPELRDYEQVPLDQDIEAYMAREVWPHAPDAWVDHNKTRVGYEIPVTRYFYRYKPPRPLEDIDADIQQLEHEILRLLGEVTR